VLPAEQTDYQNEDATKSFTVVDPSF